MSRRKLGFLFIGIGLVSLAVSVIASGLDYRQMEAQGLDRYAPTWILVWHALSLLVTIVGVIVALLPSRRADTEKHSSDY
ncbi:hypothetical protein [Corynebacterium cystitidis]|uniref:Uncharacterized protein n=1 Tax=Corynebacterium cystitidis DSM 20524 TaxID=1121357 RepID=A0A1H9NRL0_9CORY|nr:hypothetical protein [Corynebacterium cystitidis]WJY82756.1 hypothetical protein CCYS_09210 [Corynebacterium cystitidis DSM 20524]SER38674.1 hypothetical protein SAMN05661109_00075 [Corynebacterium cystitidis DSM 20524]SNV70923.1 Uncharacterised protein [Corynebacterium cystitidis]